MSRYLGPASKVFFPHAYNISCGAQEWQVNLKGSLPLQSHEAAKFHNPCYDCQYGQSPQWLHITRSWRSTDLLPWANAVSVAERIEQE